MAEVCLWKIKVGRGGGVGHLALRLKDGTYISHWPQSSTLRGAKDSSGKQHTFEQDVKDEGRLPDETLKIPDTQISWPDIKAWWFSAKAERYKFMTNNCANMVARALSEGGLLFERKMQEIQVFREQVTTLIPVAPEEVFRKAFEAVEQTKKPFGGTAAYFGDPNDRDGELSWKKFTTGRLPINMIQAGYDKNPGTESPVYVVRAVQSGGIIPGNWHSVFNFAWVSYGGHAFTTKEFEILSDPKDQLVWKTWSTSFDLRRAVPGGNDQNGDVYYIGRVLDAVGSVSRVWVGKIHPRYRSCYVADFTKENPNGIEKQFTTFDILAFK